MSQPLHVVTGATGYSGRFIAAKLLDRGLRVRTLTNSRRPDPFAGKIETHPFHFDEPDKLTASLAGAEVLYNTYWVRFNRKARPGFTHADAVKNTLALFRCAKNAGVRKVVHVSITNPDEKSPLEYFSGKATLENALLSSGIPYTILRPTVLFGGDDILINNIAWILRHMPFFGVFGDGRYKLQPIHVENLAALAIHGGTSEPSEIINAIGPETFTYRELVETIARIIGVHRPIVSLPPRLGYTIGKFLGLLTRDVVITREEIQGLMENRLFVDAPPHPLATTKLTDWAAAHRETLGRRYASELARRSDTKGKS